MNFIGNATSTPISVVNGWTKILGTTTLSSSASEMTMPSNNRLQYTPTDATTNPQIPVIIRATITFQYPSILSPVVAFSIYKNGTRVEPASYKTSTAANAFFQATVQVQTTMNSTDYIELYGTASLTDATGITVSYGSVSVQHT
jgi:hypothetical protein